MHPITVHSQRNNSIQLIPCQDSPRISLNQPCCKIHSPLTEISHCGSHHEYVDTFDCHVRPSTRQSSLIILSKPMVGFYRTIAISKQNKAHLIVIEYYFENENINLHCSRFKQSFRSTFFKSGHSRPEFSSEKT